MPHSLPLLAVLLAVPLSLRAQFPSGTSAPFQTAKLEVAKVEIFSPEANLPDAPSTSMFIPSEPIGQANVASTSGKAVAPKYANVILPGQTPVPITAGNRLAYSFHDAFNPFALIAFTISAAYSYGVDSAPHYDGSGGQSFGKREGTAALRNTVQTFSTDALFAPIFHDDPRYYQLGQGHSFVHRALYAGTRVFVTRSVSGHQRLNAPLLLGYGVAAGLNNAYYPDQDTGVSQTFENFATSLGGAALEFEAGEFLSGLRMFHHHK